MDSEPREVRCGRSAVVWLRWIVTPSSSASNDDDKGSAWGSVYVYQPDGNGVYIETKLNASEGAEFDLFGYSVAVDGDTIVVGARSDNDKLRSRGWCTCTRRRWIPTSRCSVATF
jgi:hypothetical protein